MSVERHLCKEACSFCHQPVYADEGYYGITKDHYACVQADRQEFEKAAKKIDGFFEEVGVKPKTKRAKMGHGKVAQKALKRAVEAFEEASGGKVTKSTIWCQQGSYRGTKWDLAAWGVEFEFELDGKILAGALACWATMTAVSKMEKLTIWEEGLPYTYEA